MLANQRIKMNILLGNLSVEEIENRSGVTFPLELVSYMESRQQHKAADVEPGKWHCFDIPFTLVCGDMETAVEIHKYLSPLSNRFKESLQISLANAEVCQPRS